MVKEVIIYQPALISYRIAFFEQLCKVLGGNLEVYAGIQSRENSVKTTDTSASWLRVVDNKWFLGNRLLFQQGGMRDAVFCEILVLTLNPRFIHNWLLLLARRILGKPTIIWGHLFSRAGERSWTNTVRNIQIQMGDALLVYTKAESEFFKKGSITRACMALGNSCVRRSDCMPALKECGPIPRGVLYVGRLDKSKKVNVLCEAFSLIAERESDVKLVIVGDGEEREMLQKMYQKYVNSGRMVFMGWVWEHAKLRSCYINALITVSPGYGGLNIIQSLALGVPIAVPHGEQHAPEIEACIDGFNCVWFEKDDATSLARVMVDVQRDAASWYSRRRELSDWARDRYTIEGMVEQFSNMFCNLKARRDFKDCYHVL